MAVGAFAAEVAFFDVLLSVIPSSSGVRHEHGENEACGETADEQAHDTGDADDQAGQNRNDNRDERRHEHFALSALRGNRNATRIIRCSRAFEDARDFLKLATDFDDHALGCAADRIHRQTAEEEGHHGTDEHTGEHARIHQRNVVPGHEVNERSRLNLFQKVVGVHAVVGFDEAAETGRQTFDTVRVDDTPELRLAIVFKVIESPAAVPELGTTYQWTDIADWKVD